MNNKKDLRELITVYNICTGDELELIIAQFDTIKQVARYLDLTETRIRQIIKSGNTIKHKQRKNNLIKIIKVQYYENDDFEDMQLS